MLEYFGGPRPWKAKSGSPLRSMDMTRLIQYPAFAHESHLHVAKMWGYHLDLSNDLPGLHKKLEDIAACTAVETNIARLAQIPCHKYGPHLRMTYGTLLSMAAFLNSTLRAMGEPPESQQRLRDDWQLLSESALQVGRDSIELLPLFALGMASVLQVALGGETDRDRARCIREVADVYRGDGDESWYTGSDWLKQHLRRLQAHTMLKRADEITPAETPRFMRIQDEPEGEVGRCVIL
jgi:hypothetical protein